MTRTTNTALASVELARLATVTGAGPTATVVADDHSVAVSHQDQTFKFKNKYEFGQHLLAAYARNDREQKKNALYALAGMYNSQKALDLANKL